MITNVDDNVGKMLKKVKDLGIYENTIFIYTTDNGTAYGSNLYNAGMRGRKSSEYDGGHRVPMFIHWPAAGYNKLNKIESITHAVDMAPTLLDFCGIEAPESIKFDGKSIKPLLDGKTGDWEKRYVVSDSQRVVNPVKWKQSAVMSDNWRLINGKELYQIKNDPAQKNDIAKDHPQIVAEMRAFYESFWSEIEPTFSQTTEIYIGAKEASVVELNAHDWISPSNQMPPWNQGAIRSKTSKNYKPVFDGYWALKVLEAGEYKVKISRWPLMLKHPICSSLEAGENVPGWSVAYRANKGTAFPCQEACIRLDGNIIETKEVNPTDTEISFTVKLTEGSHQLAPFFKLNDGKELGAYYASVEKL